MAGPQFYGGPDLQRAGFWRPRRLLQTGIEFCAHLFSCVDCVQPEKQYFWHTLQQLGDKLYVQVFMSQTIMIKDKVAGDGSVPDSLCACDHMNLSPTYFFFTLYIHPYRGS